MKKIISILLQVITFLLPWKIRQYILNRVSGFEIAKSARIGRSIVLADRLKMEEGSLITNLNFINKIDLLHLKSHAAIDRSNWITGASSSSKGFRNSERNCELILGKHARITSHHHIDCTGGVYVGEFTTIAGMRSQILSHSIDMKLSKQVAGPVHIGRYCFIGTSSIILKGTQIPDFCVLGAGAVLTKKYHETYRLYAGNPAKEIKEFDKEEYKYFRREHGHVA